MIDQKDAYCGDCRKWASISCQHLDDNGRCYKIVHAPVEKNRFEGACKDFEAI
jgi:hypothetical protein